MDTCPFCGFKWGEPWEADEFHVCPNCTAEEEHMRAMEAIRAQLAASETRVKALEEARELIDGMIPRMIARNDTEENRILYLARKAREWLARQEAANADK